jgi:hypothetical protein
MMGMDKAVETVLGEAVMDGVVLLPRGAAKQIRKDATPGALGGLAGFLSRVAVDKLTKDTRPEGMVRNPELRGAFLALTSSRLCLLDLEKGFLKQKVGGLSQSFSSGHVDRFEFGKAAAGVGTLDIVTPDGDRWVFEFSKVSAKKLQRMAEAIQAHVVEVD